MDDNSAIEGLNRLGLTTYEARVFMALQKLGSGPASDISDVADVPRSQVYGAADGLEARGLVEIQQSTPTIYRPVPLDQARRQLLEELERTGEETFEYLDSVRNTQDQTERTESIWMIRGREAIDSRTANLAERAEDRILYAINEPEALSKTILEAFELATERDVTVVVASVEEDVIAVTEEHDWLTSFAVPPSRDLDVDVARLLFADDETILLSTHSEDNGSSGEEVAFWTSQNAFAAVLGELAEAWMQEPFE